jgi:hypothetical protein
MKVYPFMDGDTFATFRNIVDKVNQEIKSLENDYILRASMTELENYFIDKVTINPLILHDDQYYIENQSGIDIDVSRDFNRAVFPGQRAIVRGTRIDIAIPYEAIIFWRVQASTFSMSGFPEIDVRDDTVVLTISFPDDSADPTRLKADIDRNIKSLSDAVRNLSRDVANHNSTAPLAVKEALQRKRQLAESTTGTVSALGIPIKRRDKPLSFTAPVKRRESPVSRPRVQTEAYKPEPILSENEYQHILDIMRSMSLVIERSPAAFSSLDEEAIRTHFLLQLNGHYNGTASGETFNASGKTDILIRVENKNIFIAECKFWRGIKSFDDAINQLLGYLSWRDTKCALLIFNKTKDSTAVRQKMHETMTARPEHKKTVRFEPTGDARYIFIKESDPGREIIITTQLYDIPTAE